MDKLVIENHYSRLFTQNKDLHLFLWKKLRFRDQNYFHSRLYKQRLWDGYHNFYSKETGKFLTGLLPEVKLVLSHFKNKCEVVDNRKQIKWRVKEINDQFLNYWLSEYNANSGDVKKDFTLRDFQPDLANSILKHNRGLIVAPTSSGKSAILISIIKCLPQNCPTLVMAGQKSLCDQHYDDLINWGVKDVGRLYDKYKEPNIITCATWQSAHKLGKLLPKMRALIVDEIHQNMSKGPRKIYNKLTNCSVRVGISATPFKFGGKDKTQKYLVKGYFGPPMKVKTAGETGLLTTKELQDRNILSSSDCVFYPIREPMLPYEVYQDAVTRGIAENPYFHNLVVRLAKKQKGRTLIMVERLAHGDALNAMIPGSLWVQGKDNLKTRKYIIDQLKVAKGDVVAIATTGIFNAGVNVFVMNLINAAGGKAEHQIIQRMGRGLRTAQDKEILKYYDFIFHTNDYLLDHSKKRVKILSDEKHKITIKDEIDF